MDEEHEGGEAHARTAGSVKFAVKCAIACGTTRNADSDGSYRLFHLALMLRGAWCAHACDIAATAPCTAPCVSSCPTTGTLRSFPRFRSNGMLMRALSPSVGDTSCLCHAHAIHMRASVGDTSCLCPHSGGVCCERGCPINAMHMPCTCVWTWRGAPGRKARLKGAQAAARRCTCCERTGLRGGFDLRRVEEACEGLCTWHAQP